MKLRVLGLRKPHLCQQLPEEAYIASLIVAILHQPLRQRTSRE
jgi:hypothetical protein